MEEVLQKNQILLHLNQFDPSDQHKGVTGPEVVLLQVTHHDPQAALQHKGGRVTFLICFGQPGLFKLRFMRLEFWLCVMRLFGHRPMDMIDGIPDGISDVLISVPGHHCRSLKKSDDRGRWLIADKKKPAGPNLLTDQCKTGQR